MDRLDALWQTSTDEDAGRRAEPVAEPGRGDTRFKDDDWQEHFAFDYIKQSYLIAARVHHTRSPSVEGLSEKSQKKVAFFTRQYVDALAPTNFVLTNPEVLRETVATGGQNLVKGLNNLLADIEGRRRAARVDDRREGIRARQQRRDLARQGGVPTRS